MRNEGPYIGYFMYVVSKVRNFDKKKMNFISVIDSTILEINGTQLNGRDSFKIYVGKMFDAKFTSTELITKSTCKFFIDWKCTPQLGREGFIELIDYDNYQQVHWEIQSECENILVDSKIFVTVVYRDYLIIGGVEYSGERNISQIIKKSDFVADFYSDKQYREKSFRLNWSCLIDPFEKQNGTGRILFDFSDLFLCRH